MSILYGREKQQHFLEAPQALPASPRGRTNRKMKMQLYEEYIWKAQRNCHFYFPLIQKRINWKLNLIIFRFKAKRINFNKFKSGGLHETHAAATCNLGNHLSICLKTEKIQENLYRNGRSHDIPDAHWLLAMYFKIHFVPRNKCTPSLSRKPIS